MIDISIERITVTVYTDCNRTTKKCIADARHLTVAKTIVVGKKLKT